MLKAKRKSGDSQTSTGQVRPGPLAWLPIPILLGAMAILWAANLPDSYGSNSLIMALNFVFATLVSGLIVLLVSRSFLTRGTPGLLMLGCGVLAWGAAGLVAKVVNQRDANLDVTVHNSCVWVSALFHFAGALLLLRSRRALQARELWLGAAYAGVLGVLGLVVLGAVHGYAPIFFVQGTGGTPIRQWVLGSAIVMFLATAGLLKSSNGRPFSAFRYWYILALCLIALGLFGIMIESVFASLLSWMGLAAQFLSGVYMLIAAIASVRESGTWQVSLEAALRQSEARYAAFAAAAFEGIVESEAGRIVDCNEQCAQIFGRTIGELQGTAIADLVAPEDRARVAANVTENRDSLIEHACIRRDGTRIIVEARGRPAVPGSPRRSTAIRDITERKRAEESLAAAHRQIQSIIDNATAIVYALDLEERFILANAALAEILSSTPDQMIGKRRHELMPREDADWHEANDRQVIEAGRALEFEEYSQLKGRSITWLTTKFPLRDAQGKICAVAGISTDITERKRTEAALHQAKAAAEAASKAKDHFIAVLSHELRNPLNPVLATVAMLRKDSRFDADTHEQLDVIHRNVELEARLIDDLLDVTRIERGKIELDRRPVELCTIIRRAAEVCLPEIQAGRLEFGLDLGPAPYWVEADAARLQQVFWNLIKNAIKFTPEGGSVRVRCSRTDGDVAVEVNDAGEGIDPEVLPRLFAAFEQGGRPITRQFGGLGLGLTISKALVELHGGSIAAHSEGKGKGATFTVRLPLVAAEAALIAEAVPSAAPPAGKAARPLRILLVEDHGDTARIMRRLLSAQGHVVQTAGDMATALNVAGEQAFDLLLSDLGLPDGSGLDLMRNLRQRGLTLPGIALSGYGQERDLEQSREAGFAAHVVKPVNMQRLDEIIARIARADA